MMTTDQTSDKLCCLQSSLANVNSGDLLETHPGRLTEPELLYSFYR